MKTLEIGATCPSFSPDGQLLIIALGSKVLYLNPQTFETTDTLDIDHGIIKYVQFNYSGEKLITTTNSSTIVWDVETGMEIKRLKGHSAKCNSASFSHNGGKIVSTSVDNTIRVWDVSSDKEIRIIDGNIGSVHAAIFSLDDNYVISTVEREIKIWGALSLGELISKTRERFKNCPLTLEERKKYYLD